MKNYILFIALTFGVSAVKAQNFEKTTKYIAKSELATKQEEYGKTKVTILLATEESQKVATLEMYNSENFHEMRISVMANPQLNRINEVIKVEFEYIGYSLAIDTYYFLVTDKKDYIALPKITKIYDDISEPIIDYVFPTQNYGREETILKAIFHYTNNYTSQEIEVLQSIVWNDDDFDAKDAIAGIEHQ